MDLDPTIKCELTSSERVAQYFAADPQRPFAVLNGKKQPATVLLACSPQILSDPHKLAQARDTNSAFQTSLEISGEPDLVPALSLIQQAFKLNR